MFNNLGQMMSQMQKIQDEIQQLTVEVTSVNGAITVVMSGRQDLVSVKLDEAIIQNMDVTSVEDEFVQVLNEAIARSRAEVKERLSQATGLNISGLMNMFT
ncbi:YbaB/EbfC family nucleoid-associated protein [Peptococcaceae bacterium 1198_IL3148]